MAHFLRACFPLIDPLHLTALTGITHSFTRWEKSFSLFLPLGIVLNLVVTSFALLKLFDLVFRMQFNQFSSPKAVLAKRGEKKSLLKNEFLSIKEYGTRLRYDENILLSNVDVYFLFTNLGAFYCLENSVAICKWYFYWTLLGIIVIFFI